MKVIIYFRNPYFVMFTLILSILSFTGLTELAYAQSKETVKLNGGTVVALRLDGAVNSEMKEGTPIQFRVLRDVKVDDIVVIKQGALATGSIAEVKSSGALGSGGKIALNVNSVKAVDGQEIFLSGSVRQEGEDKVALSVILGILCLPLLLINGSDAVIPDGTEVRTYTVQDYNIKVQ